MMELQLLGRGSAFYPALGNTAAYVREGQRLLLLDCGETVFGELLRRGLLTKGTQITALISHTHSDHCGSLGTLAQYCYYMLGCPLRVAVPSCNPAYARQLAGLVRTYGMLEDQTAQVTDRDVTGFEAFRSVRYVPTIHAPEMPAFSFVFETTDDGLFYSADTCDAAPLKAFIASHPGFEAAYVDTAESDFPGCVHLSVRQLCEAVPPALRSRVHMMHVNSERCVELGREAGFVWDV